MFVSPTTRHIPGLARHDFVIGGLRFNFYDLRGRSLPADFRRFILTPDGALAITKVDVREFPRLMEALSTLEEQGKLDD